LAALCVLGLVGRTWPEMVKRGFAALTSAEPPPVPSLEPLVADVELTLRYPEYTELPPRVIEGSSGHILALPGTRVTIVARPLIANDGAKLVLEEEDAATRELPVEMSGGKLHATVDVLRRGSWRFVLHTGGAHRLAEPEAHRIELSADRAPRVDLAAPADPLTITRPKPVELGYSIDDDYGLSLVELVYKKGDGPEQRKLIAKPDKGTRSLSGKLEWDLGELGLAPGQRVAYRLEAKDNDTVPGPNIGSSRTLTLLMANPHEQEERSLEDAQQLLEEAVQLLADRLEVPRGEDDLIFESFTRVHSRAEALLLALARLEQSELGVEPKRRAALGEMHVRLGKLAQQEEVLLSELRDKRRKSGQPLRPGQAKPLEKGNVAEVAELERDVLLLDDLLGKKRLEALLAVADELSAARDRLKKLLSDYKKTKDPALKQEIERQLREMEQKLAELMKKAQRLSGELPDQYLNAEAMGRNDMQSRIDDIRQMLDKGDVDKALDELSRLSSTLDRMTSSMEADLRGYRRERFSAEDKAIAELENKLADLGEEERRLYAETEEVAGRARQEAQRQMKDKIDALTKKTKDKLERLRKQLDQIDPIALSGYEAEELERVKKRVDDTARALAEGDIDEARGMADNAHDGLREMAMDLHDRELRHSSGKMRATREQVSDDEMLAREIADELERAMPKPSQLVGPGDKRKLDELQKRQGALRKRTQELMREKSSKQMEAGLKEAGQHMERAEERLGRDAAREAGGSESQALDKLSDLKRQLDRERRPREDGGSRLDRETVRIPGADEWRAPKEFRDELMRGMKHDAPAVYKEQLKRYYEELAK
jgi:hypothetical protein